MLPSARVVLENPLLHRVSFNPETWSLITTTDELAVDLPLAVASLEPEGASDARRIGGVRELVEVDSRRDICGIDAVVRYYRAVDDDLQDLITLTCAENVSGRTASVFLLQAVLKEERLTGVVG